MKQRIIGFDLARAYAIFGMYIVNFNFSFGSVMSPNDSIGHFLNIFTGNSTAIFIICAGMVLSLMCNKKTLTVKEIADLKSKVVKRQLVVRRYFTLLWRLHAYCCIAAFCTKTLLCIDGYICNYHISFTDAVHSS